MMLNPRFFGPALLVLATATAYPAWAAPLPPVHAQGPVRYLSGGIGKDEARAVEAAAPAWPAVLEFVKHDAQAKGDAFLAEVSVQVLDAHQRTVLATVSEGPFVLARLDPGRYEVRATVEGQTLTRTLQVPAQGSSRAVFVWPGRAAHPAA
jgi:hypothetical protein